MSVPGICAPHNTYLNFITISWYSCNDADQISLSIVSVFSWQVYWREHERDNNNILFLCFLVKLALWKVWCSGVVMCGPERPQNCQPGLAVDHFGMHELWQPSLACHSLTFWLEFLCLFSYVSQYVFASKILYSSATGLSSGRCHKDVVCWD